jgi:hypothetical protein
MGEMAMRTRAYGGWLLAYLIAVSLLTCMVPAPARADFFDDMRRTFTTDIPHFFQDDIPCAFGGQPTSHTKTSCKSAGGHTTDVDRDGSPSRPDETNGAKDKSPNYD